MFGHRGFEYSSAVHAHSVDHAQTVEQEMSMQAESERPRPSSAPPMAANFNDWQEGYSSQPLMRVPPGVEASRSDSSAGVLTAKDLIYIISK